jgi:hypothetical protein
MPPNQTQDKAMGTNTRAVLIRRLRSLQRDAVSDRACPETPLPTRVFRQSGSEMLRREIGP